MELVRLENDRPITTSRLIADKFGKQHFNVLRDIRNLDCSPEFNEINFDCVDYKDKKGETRNEFHITRDGFTFLVMGFTGKEAAKFKEDYINAFNDMEKQLKAPKELSKLEVLELAIKSEKERLKLKAEVDKLLPKAKLYDKVMDDGRLFSVSEVAKILKIDGIGRNKLYGLLRDWGLLFHNKNEPKQEYINRGYFEVRYNWIEHLQMKIPTTKVTNKGLKYIEQKLNQHFGLIN